jgi:hypothetical protein
MLAARRTELFDVLFHTRRYAINIRNLMAAYPHRIVVTVSPLLVRSVRKTRHGCHDKSRPQRIAFSRSDAMMLKKL